MRAFSLIESAIVLGVVGLVIGGIWVAAASINTTRKIDQTAVGLVILANDYIKLYEGYNVSVFSNGGVSGSLFPVIPDGFRLKSNGTIVDPFGKDMYIDKYVMGGNVSVQFYLYSQSIDSCINLMTKLSYAPHIWRFAYNPSTNLYTSAPVTFNNASTYCKTRTGTTTGYYFHVF